MASMIVLLALCALFALCTASELSHEVHMSNARCGQKCKFRFCRADGFDTIFDNTGPRLLLRDKNVASQPFVCKRLTTGSSVRVKILKTGTSSVYQAPPVAGSEPFKLVNKFRTSPKFPKKYIGMKEITKFPPIPNKVGILRSKSGGKFEEDSNNLCVSIPITDYNIMKGNGKIDRKVKKCKDPEDCISFRTIVPKILIEATWDSGDDLDINVQEPGPRGEKISFRDTSSASGGRLNLDQNVGRCDEGDPNGREQIRWLLGESNPPNGTYTVQIKHFDNCGNGPTKWNVAVIIMCKVKVLKSGTSDKSGDQLIEEFTFKF